MSLGKVRALHSQTHHTPVRNVICAREGANVAKHLHMVHGIKINECAAFDVLLQPAPPHRI